MTRLRLTTSLTVLALLLSATSVPAQDARLDAAKKEGKVVWYTSLALSSSEKVAKLFEATYPGIKVEVHRTGSGLGAKAQGVTEAERMSAMRGHDAGQTLYDAVLR